MKKLANHPSNAVWLLIVLQFLLGLGALAGGAALVMASDGSILQMPLSSLEHSPFPNYLIPGVILFILLGVYPLVVAYSLWQQPAWRWPEALNPIKDKHWSWVASLSVGVILVIWITVQVLLIRSIASLHVLYFIWGWVLILLTLNKSVRGYCSH
ncbi:MAG: hypothetical protein A2W35_14255 [Chloroflexi bacterium RBG_16_57_11]|nr:MAG: hypothetical protein A2W35_14255 [Chloroflexi bacterium RBG_16_57_11]